MKTACIRKLLIVSCIPFVFGCAAPKPAIDDFALKGMFQLTRADVEKLEAAIPKKGKKSLRVSGKNAVCAPDVCALSWGSKTIPLYSGDEKAATLELEDGSAKLTRQELAGLRRLMTDAKKSGPRAFRRANQGQVVCRPDRCTVDLSPMFALSSKEVTAEVLQALLRSATRATPRKL